MPERYNIGCIGVSHHMEEHLIPSINILPQLNLYGIASRSEEKRRRLHDHYRLTPVADWRELIADPRIDAIVVAGPPSLNSTVVEECIKNSKVVFSEKPCAENTTRLKHLIRLTEMLGGKTQIGYNFRFSSYYQNVLNLRAAFGDIRSLDIVFNTNKPLAPLWGHSTTLESFLYAIAIHPLEIACSLLGKPFLTYVENTRLASSLIQLLIHAHDGKTFVRLATGNHSNSLEISFRATYESGDQVLTDNHSPNIVRLRPNQHSASSGIVIGAAKSTEFFGFVKNNGRDREGSGYQAEFIDFCNLIHRGTSPNGTSIAGSLNVHEMMDEILTKLT